MLVPIVAPAALTALALAGDVPAAAGSGVRYALVPPRNLTGDAEALDAVVGGLQRELERRGATFADPREIDAVLRARRVRYTDSIARADLEAIRDATGAGAAIVGTLLEYVPGGAPRIAATLRVLSAGDGTRVASSVVSLRGEDFEGLLGLGRIEDVETLAAETVERLASLFDERGAPRAAPAARAGRARPSPPDGGHGFAREDFDARSIERVAVLPLANRSRHPEAASVFAELLGDAWSRSGRVQVVEPADLRAAMVAQKVRSMQFVDLARLAELGRAIGVRYFAVGSVDRFGDEVLVDDDRYPEVQATVQIIDAERATIVAAAGLRRVGNEYASVLGLGVVRDRLELARRAAREIVNALGG
jgi:hypothetical protein